MAHRAAGAIEDAVGAGWNYEIRKEKHFLKAPCLHNPMFGLSSSLSRVRSAAPKSSAPLTTLGDRREPSGYEGKGLEYGRQISAKSRRFKRFDKDFRFRVSVIE